MARIKYLLLISLLATSGTATELVVEANLREDPSRELILDFKLVNVSSNTITMPLGYLPWTWSGAVTMTIVRVAPDNEPVALARPVSDPPIGDISIAPGESLQGEININRHFQNLVEIREKSRLVLFWHWIRGQRSRNLRPEEHGGWFIIERAR